MTSAPTNADTGGAPLRAGQVLEGYTWLAFNYAQHSANRMHGDEVAPKYGFALGLVPGISNYAALTHVAVDLLGRAWLEHGAIEARFRKPLYDGECASLRATVETVDPVRLRIELLNAEGAVCSTGIATLPDLAPPIDPAAYPRHLHWAGYRLPPAEYVELPEGQLLASQDSRIDISRMQAEFLDMVGETLPLYRQPDAPCHPAALLTRANDMLKFNTDLGPWIHAGSDVRHHALPRDGETISARGRVGGSYEKSGHGFVELDLGFFGQGDRSIMEVRHIAIVRPRVRF